MTIDIEAIYGPVRKLTYEERATWGTCEYCQAEHGTPCHKIGATLSGTYPDGGVHLCRLKRAPTKVREVPA